MTLDLGIDFKSQAFVKKLKSAHLGAQPLKKALLTRGKRVTIVDATAGRGEDSFLMAEWGFEVIAFEENPEVFKQLSQALEQLSINDPAQRWIQSKSLRFLPGDFFTEIKKLGLSPEVIYLDPMYPKSNKSARSEKAIENLRALVGEANEDLEVTLNKALSLAKTKVVLKRPQSAESEFIANHVYEGASTRYEVFLTSTPLRRISKKD